MREDLQVVGWADCLWRPAQAETEFQRAMRELAEIIAKGEAEEARRQRSIREAWKRKLSF